jgi:hypothetical protein
MCTKFNLRSLNFTYLRNLDLDERIILRWILEEWGVKWSELKKWGLMWSELEKWGVTWSELEKWGVM